MEPLAAHGLPPPCVPLLALEHDLHRQLARSLPRPKVVEEREVAAPPEEDPAVGLGRVRTKGYGQTEGEGEG